MAEQHPMIGGKLEGMSNVTYDLVTVLSNAGEAIDALASYIDDAKKAGDSEVQRFFEQMREDEIRHCDMLRNLIDSQAKHGKL